MNLINTRYAFTSAYLKGEESRIVTSDHIDGMIQRSSTIQDAVDTIRSTDIGEYLWELPLNSIEDIEESLWKYFDDCFGRLEKFHLPADFSHLMESFLTKYDILNAKIALRCTLTDRPPLLAPLGEMYRQGFLEELSKAVTVQEIGEILVKATLGQYVTILDDMWADMGELNLPIIVCDDNKVICLYLDEIPYDKIYSKVRDNYLNNVNTRVSLMKKIKENKQNYDFLKSFIKRIVELKNNEKQN